jgi:hypothetical protein
VWGPKSRAFGYAAVAAGAALLVFFIQSVSVGVSLGGALLALAVGGMALLVLMLLSNP